jgi:uncharacterized protein (TIGR03000 family)
VIQVNAFVLSRAGWSSFYSFGAGDHNHRRKQPEVALGGINMFREIASLTGLISLAVLGMLMSARPAAAQNEGYSRWAAAHGSGGSSSWGTSGGWRSRRSYVPRESDYYDYGAAANAPITRSQSYYYAPVRATTVNNTVTLNLTVPADAKIWIEGTPTSLQGTRRQFVSPPIQPGDDYTYDFQVSWNQDGREVTNKRQITVHAGDVVNLTFPSR